MTATLEILFENKNLVVVNKPANFLSVPSRHGIEDPRPVVGLELQKMLGHSIYPVHRLDLEVSGILIFAKVPSAQRILNEVFEKRTVKKTYAALTEGTVPPQNKFRWENLLVRGKRRSFVAPHGKTAITEARFQESLPGGELRWELEPLTGRAHQLRVHLSQNGFPILGDELYGATKEFSEAGIALRAVAITLPVQAAQRLEAPDNFNVRGPALP